MEFYMHDQSYYSTDCEQSAIYNNMQRKEQLYAALKKVQDGLAGLSRDDQLDLLELVNMRVTESLSETMVRFDEMPSSPSKQVPIDSRGHQETFMKGADIQQAQDSPRQHDNSAGKQTPKFGSPMTKKSRRKVEYVSKRSTMQLNQELNINQVGGKNESVFCQPLMGDIDNIQDEDDQIYPLTQYVRFIQPKVARKTYLGQQDTGKFDEGVQLTKIDLICTRVEYQLNSELSHFKRESQREIQVTKNQWNHKFSVLFEEMAQDFAVFKLQTEEKKAEIQEKWERMFKYAILPTQKEENIEVEQEQLEKEEAEQSKEEAEDVNDELPLEEVKTKKGPIQKKVEVFARNKEGYISFQNVNDELPLEEVKTKKGPIQKKVEVTPAVFARNKEGYIGFHKPQPSRSSSKK